MFKKNISDDVGSPNGSNGTPLDPPLFWLDNIFKLKDTSREGAIASADPVYAYILFATIGLLFFVYGTIYFRVSEVMLDNFVWWRAVNIIIFD